MKKYMNFPLILLAILFSGCLFSCDDDDDDIDTPVEKDQQLKPAIGQYVDNTVIATYKLLADYTIELREDLIKLRNEKTDENVKKAAETWKKARNVWELSEAFLFGPADILGIDPHIDSWPLDEQAFLGIVNNKALIESIDKDESVWAGEHAEESVLGFHGLEYILFEGGNVKKAADIPVEYVIYAKAVSADLRNQCLRLEAGWAGPSAVSPEKQEIIKNNNLQLLTSDMPEYYGVAMKNAGEGSTTFKTVTAAAAAIIDGCITIADEVAAQKIGQPHTGEDINYIESPYSYNSKIDFADNVRSIQNAYLGGADASKRGPSVSDYIKRVAPEVDAKIKAAAEDAIKKINSIPFPFVKNFTAKEAGEAMEACTVLKEALEEANIVLREDK